MHRRFVSALVFAALALLLSTGGAGVDAVVARRRVVTRPPDGEIALPPFNAQPFITDSVFFSWTIRLDNVTREWILSGRFNFSSNAWFGIGLRAPKRMQGPLIICYIDASSGVAHCDDYVSGSNYERPRRVLFSAPRTVATDADVSSEGIGYIVFDTKIQLGNESDDEAMILRDSMSRVIFARGMWDSAKDEPVQHASDEVAAMLINFDSGEVSKFEADSHKATFFVLAAAVPLSAIVGFVDTNRHFPRQPKNLRLGLQAFGVACYLGLLIMYIALRYNDYVEKVAGKALWRAVGDGATFILSCMVLPVSKRGLFHDGYGVSHEKAIKYHLFQAILLIILVIIHMAAWIKYYTFDWVVRWAEKDKRSHLPGLLTLITAVVVMGPALMRQRNWRMFRVTHYGVVIIYFFAVLHFPPLAFGVTPSLLLHLAAAAITRYRETRDFRQSIEAAYFDEQANIVVIDILRSTPVRPGKYFMLRLPELNSGEMHPFSIAKMTPIGNNPDPGLCQHRSAHLSTIPRAQEDESDPLLTHPPLSGQLTSDLVGGDTLATIVPGNDKDVTAVEKQAEDWCMLRLMIKISKDNNSWTWRLSQFLRAKQISSRNYGAEMISIPFSNFRINGPYGRLEANPAVYCQFVFVAGGIGINPLLYTLQCMSLGMVEYTGDPLGYLAVTLYWVVREETTYECYIQDLVQCKKRLEKLAPACSVHIRVIITGKEMQQYQERQRRLAKSSKNGKPTPASMPAVLSPKAAAAGAAGGEDDGTGKNDINAGYPGPHTPAILDQDSARLLTESVLVERTSGKRPDFSELGKDALRRCRKAAEDPRHVIAAEDTTPEREALLREAVCVMVSGPPEMSAAAIEGFRTADSAGDAEEQPLVLHFEQFKFSI